MHCDDCKRTDVKCCSTCRLHKTDCNVWHNCGKDCPGYAPQTNADHIRAMTDGELAKGIIDGFDMHFCTAEEAVECDHIEWVNGLSPCGICLLDWLKQPCRKENE